MVHHCVGPNGSMVNALEYGASVLGSIHSSDELTNVHYVDWQPTGEVYYTHES